MGHRVSHQLVAESRTRYSLQANHKKTREGPPHPAAADAQFRHLTAQVRQFRRRVSRRSRSTRRRRNWSAISRMQDGRGVRRVCPNGCGCTTFSDPRSKGRRFPTTISRNDGWVSVGIDHDTASFAVRTIRRWWQQMGTRVSATLAPAHHGGRGWQQREAPPALEVGIAAIRQSHGLTITVCHFPPGTSKWNRIEHRLFSVHRPELAQTAASTLAAIVSLIGAMRTTTRPRVRCELDRGTYPKGHAISDEQLAALRLTPHRFHGDWNYTVHPIRWR